MTKLISNRGSAVTDIGVGHSGFDMYPLASFTGTVIKSISLLLGIPLVQLQMEQPV